MSQRERDRTKPADPAVEPAGAGDGLDGARSDAERLLRAADNAIARALSANSERFLEATRQSGGE